MQVAALKQILAAQLALVREQELARREIQQLSKMQQLHSAEIFQNQQADASSLQSAATTTGSIELELLFEKFKREIIYLFTQMSCHVPATGAFSSQTLESYVASPELQSGAKSTRYQGRESGNKAVLSSLVAHLDECTNVEQRKALETSESAAINVSMWDKESASSKHSQTDPDGTMLRRDKTALIKCSRLRRPVSKCHSADRSSVSLTMQSLPEIYTGYQSECAVTVQPGLPLECTKLGGVNGNILGQDYDTKDTKFESSEKCWRNISMQDGDMRKDASIPPECSGFMAVGAAVSTVKHPDHPWDPSLSFTSALNSAGDSGVAINGAWLDRVKFFHCQRTWYWAERRR